MAAIFRKLNHISQPNRREIVKKSPLIYTCDKSCIRERDKNSIKNRMYNPANSIAPLIFVSRFLGIDSWFSILLQVETRWCICSSERVGLQI